MLKEFKEFAVKGNVVDLAVAVIIGGAFGKIVTSLVNDLVMPLLGILLGRINLSELKYVIKPEKSAEVVIKYGNFLQSVVDFLIISFTIFLFVKLISNFKKKEEAPTEEEITPDGQQVLLEEIRDLLKEKL